MASNALPESQNLLQTFVEAVGRQEAVAFITVVRSAASSGPPLGAKLLLWGDGRTAGSLGAVWDAEVLDDAQQALKEGVSQSFHYPKVAARTRQAEESEAFQVYVEVVRPPGLLVVGAGHIGACVARLGKLAGFHVTVLDDREDFASRERLPEVDEVLCEDFVSALQQFPITESTYVVVVTRGHKQDEASVRQVVDSSAAYIGMIDSRRRSAAVLKLLHDSGVPREALARIRTPIGLDIRAETPEEIAVSIIAEIIMVRYGGTGLPLSQVARVTPQDL